jgi:hypothetical protein
MREIYKSGVTPQQKIVAVNNKFGNTSIKDQQGTTRIIYDSLEVTSATQTTFKFFEDSASRNFPFTNTGSDGNKLGVGDTMVISQVSFSVFFKNASGIYYNNNDLVTFQTGLGLSLFNITLANNQVVKKLSLTEALGNYSKDTLTNATTIDLETEIVIPPLLNFDVELILPAGLTAPANNTLYVRCALIGVGGIIAPRTTF